MARLIQIHLLLIVMGAVASLSSCTKKQSNGALHVTADYVVLSGVAVDADGAGVSNANIFIEQGSESVAISESDGSFKIRLSDTDMTSLLGNSNAQYRIYLDGEKNGMPIVGRSAEINTAAVGAVDLGTISMNAAASYGGLALLYQAGDILKPATGAALKVQRSSGVVDEQGNFVVTNLANGGSIGSISFSGYESSEFDINLDAGAQKIRTNSIVLFKVGSVNGHTFTYSSENSKFDPEHPFRKKFGVNSSSAVGYIRYHHDQEIFNKYSATEGWREIREEFNYDFPENGSHYLYVQYADKNKENVSELQKINTVTDIFANTVGFTINDGAESTRTLRVNLTLYPPPLAVELRVSEDLKDFFDTPAMTLPWMKLQEAQEFIFGIGTNLTAHEKLLFLQYRTSTGDISPSYRQSIFMDPFPNAGKIFSIEGGEEVTTNRVVDVKISAPEGATEMVIFEEVVSGGLIFIGGTPVTPATRANLEKYWVQVEEEIKFTFLNVGRKVLYIKFRNAENIESTIYQMPILVRPFDPNDNDGFIINQGEPVWPSRQVTIFLNPPPLAVAAKISQNPFGIQAAPLQILGQPIPMVLDDVGQNDIYVQYQDIDGTSSYVYMQSIFVEPFYGATGLLTINGGAEETFIPYLDLEFEPPVGAYEMQYFEGRPPTDSDAWLPTTPLGELAVFGRGLKHVFARYRTITGEVSTIVEERIYYDPFPIIAPERVLINNGDLVTQSREVVVKLIVPPSAVGMRVQNRVRERSIFVVPEYVQPKSEFNVTLPAILGIHRILVEFRSIDGVLSSFYFDDIQLDLYPDANQTLTINGGDASTDSNLVEIGLNPPPSARFVRIADSLSGLTAAPRQGVSTSINYQLPGGDGIKTVFACYDTDDPEGESGPVMQSTIILQSFPTSFSAIELDGGAAKAYFSTVNAVFSYPPQAFKMRVSQSLTSLTMLPYSDLTPTASYDVGEADGFKTIYVQFQSISGDDSSVYFDQIDLELFPSSMLSAQIDGGNSTTTADSVVLTLDPPIGAESVRVSEDPATLAAAPLYTPMTQMSFTLSAGLGQKTVYIQYVSANGRSSNTFSATIEKVAAP